MVSTHIHSLSDKHSKDGVKLACRAPLIFSKASRGVLAATQEEHRMDLQSLIHLFYLSRGWCVCKNTQHDPPHS